MELKSGYKLTEVGVIPEDWEVRPLGELMHFQNGVNAEKGAYGKGIRFANVLEVITRPYLHEEDIPGRINLSGDAIRSYSVKRGDVLFNRTSETQQEIGLASVYLGSRPIVFGGFVIRGRPTTDSLLPIFAGNALRGKCVRVQVVALGQGAVRANIGQADLKKVMMPLPSRAEQQSIADALNDADALIESLEQLLVKKRQIKQGTMQELLTGKKRLPGFTSSWKAKLLRDVAPLQRGFDLPTGQIEQGPYPVVYSNGVLAHHAKYQAKAPGVVTGRSGTIGKVAFVNQNYWPHNTSLWVTDFKGNDPKLIFYLFISIGLARFSSGSGVPTLNRNDVHAYGISIPQDAEEQSAIAAVLSDIDAEIAALETKLTKARQIKQGMMQELLTGRIRLIRPSAEVLSFPAKESASVASVPHNTQINEAVVIAVLSAKFGSEQFPLGRFRRTKFSYLLHRHAEQVAAGFLKKAAGPYNPRTRYGGAEKIALQNRYVRVVSTEKSEGFVADQNIAQAEGYFEKWYGAEALTWLEQFRYQKNDALELLTTVDMACEDLSRVGKVVTTSTVKQIIHDSPEWKAKLNRSVFSDDNIAATIGTCRQLFSR
jgi:type I restriction enzyme S subunit